MTGQTFVVVEWLFGLVGVVDHVVGYFENALAPQRTWVQLQTDEREYGQHETGKDSDVAQTTHGFQ